MKCLLFGAKGYIGRHLKATLLAEGHEVCEPQYKKIDNIDLSDKGVLQDIDWDVDCVYLFAGSTGTSASFEEYSDFVKGNELILLNILDSIRRSGFRPKLIYPSSRLVYKGSQFELLEDSPLEAKTVYAASKIACEYYLESYSNAYDIPYVVYRIGVPYGNLIGENYSYGTIGHFISKAMQGKSITLYGDGLLRRSFTHIDDLCRLIVLSSNDKSIINTIFNMPGEDMSLREIAEMLGNRTGVQIECIEWPEFDLRIESGNTVFDGTKLLNILNTNLKKNMCSWISGLRL